MRRSCEEMLEAKDGELSSTLDTLQKMSDERSRFIDDVEEILEVWEGKS